MALDLPPRTSASQLVSYAMCPRKYAMKYVLDLEPEFVSVALVLGSAVHGAVGWWYEERLAGREPTLGGALEIATADLASAVAGETVRWKTSSQAHTEEEARRLVATYLGEYGDLPVVAVEQPFAVDVVHPETGELLGRPLKGYFDLVLADGSVVELKTASRGWDGDAIARHLQVGAYAYVLRERHDDPPPVRVDVVVKLKREPRTESFMVDHDPRKAGWWLEAFREIETAIQRRQFPPTPGPLCRECEHGTRCAEWTTQVDLGEERVRLPFASRSTPLHLYA
jgi:hypothetical protein